MAEQFDMGIYNTALTDGSYTPPQNNTPQGGTPNLSYVGDSASNPNLVYMTEGYNPNNLDYRNFSNNSEKK